MRRRGGPVPGRLRPDRWRHVVLLGAAALVASLPLLLPGGGAGGVGPVGLTAPMALALVLLLTTAAHGALSRAVVPAPLTTTAGRPGGGRVQPRVRQCDPAADGRPQPRAPASS